MSAEVPGTSLTTAQLLSLPYTPQAPSTPSAAAKLISDRYLATHQERPQDERLRSGSLVGHHAAELRAALRQAGCTAQGADLAKMTHTVETDGDVAREVERLRALHPAAFEPKPRRSADDVAQRITG